jgi:hypothetical protein
MSHFAKVVDGKVTQVIVAEQDVIDSGLFGSPSEWIQTSYNTHANQHPNGTPLRGNFAGIGYTYDKVNDVFYSAQPYPSWILNNAIWTWEPPVARPADENHYIWDETIVNWKEIIITEEN